MPTFDPPTEFVHVRRSAYRRGADSFDLVGILAQHLEEFLAMAAGRTSLPLDAAANLFDGIGVYTDFELLRKSGATEWIFVTPAPAFTTAQAIEGLSDIGMTVRNSSMPPHAQSFFRSTEAGRLQNSSVSIIQRSALVAVCCGLRAGTFRVADAIYLWLNDCIPTLRLEFAAQSVQLTPARSPEEGERPLFAAFPQSPVVVGVTTTTPRRVDHGLIDPP